jgi:uncharacterized cupin superfamily protein
MAGRESFAICHSDDLESTGSWRLVRRSLGIESFGANCVEIPVGETIPEHDELERDQEELFVVLAGEPALVIDGEEHQLREGSFARVDPAHKRTVRNTGAAAARVLIVSAPRTSGYTPMGWA